jgi:hypothetical protein
MKIPLPDATRGGAGGLGVRLDNKLPRIDWGGPLKPKPPPTDWWDCPQCLVEHEESAVIIEDEFVSTMNVTTFYDKAGNLHVHNPNLRTVWMYCTRRHRWAIQETIICPELTCIWPTTV